jgi:hypothetical protein
MLNGRVCTRCETGFLSNRPFSTFGILHGQFIANEEVLTNLRYVNTWLISGLLYQGEKVGSQVRRVIMCFDGLIFKSPLDS